MASIPKVPLIIAPTPLHRLDRVSADLGIDLWIKRDDLTGFAMGGNKGRKLEFLIAAALAEGAQAVVTCGSLQSNFIRQLGAACEIHGIECHAVVMDTPFEFNPPKVKGLRSESGNALLGEWLGIKFVRMPDGHWDDLFAKAEAVAVELERSGKKVYRIPVGGSSPLGAFAFLEAGRELQEQRVDFDSIVFASSSGSTQVGLSHAFWRSGTKVLGIACDPEPEIAQDFGELSSGLALISNSGPIAPQDFLIDFNFVGPGYGIPSEPGNEAISYLARKEGIFLDPIYSAKAFAGLKALVGQGKVNGKVCFWHTGGTPALFSMHEPEAAN